MGGDVVNTFLYELDEGCEVIMRQPAILLASEAARSFRWPVIKFEQSDS